jgi:hypothetical protein
MHDQRSASHHSEVIVKGMSKGMMVLRLIEVFVEAIVFCSLTGHGSVLNIIVHCDSCKRDELGA